LGVLFTALAILKNYDVYNVPKYIKKDFTKRTSKLLFSILVAWMIPGITGSISEVFSIGNNIQSTMLYKESEFMRAVFLFMYSTLLPIASFTIFQKKYYSRNN
jgi:hypothetical protein